MLSDVSSTNPDCMQGFRTFSTGSGIAYIDDLSFSSFGRATIDQDGSVKVSVSKTGRHMYNVHRERAVKYSVREML